MAKKEQEKKLETPVDVNNVGKLEARPIVTEMQESYLDYAMSVIVSRALPDVRDGMKPVHRRILYAMWDLGLRAGSKYRKSATVVGEVLGKYHPHGDSAVYESMVRMAQYFSLRYRLVDGQGNFGSMDGDSAAAMRYTEARLAKISDEMLSDIEKNTVDFMPNYDGSRNEPTVLPAKLPNLLLNGTVGIAVGMSTSIPPHNLNELMNAIHHLIEHPDADVEDLMEFVHGPDFPTGGIIYNQKDILQAYATGKGPIVMRAKTEIIEEKGVNKIIVTEIPFQVNKADLITRIADLARDKKIEGIRDLRDESDKEGVRIVIELKRDAYPKKVLNRLFTATDLQTSFPVNMLALIDGLQPRVLNLKSILEEYIKYRQIVVRRRTQFDLDKAKDRAHILEGLKIAVDNIDAVIKIIKKSADKDEAKINLMKRFKLSERQSIAILEMKLQQLANLERLKIEDELKEKRKLIKELQAILGSQKRILAIIVEEGKALVEKYGDERKTEVQKGAVGEFSQEDLIPNEACIVMITRDGYIKRVPPETFRKQGRGGKGVVGLTTKEEDTVEHLFSTMTHADLLFFTTRGRAFQLKAYDVPVSSRTAKGNAIVNFLQLGPDEKVSAVMSMADLKSSGAKFLVMLTHNGIIKKVELDNFVDVRRSGLIAIKLKAGDKLQWVQSTSGDDDVLLVSQNGQCIRYKEKKLRPMGRNASGVRGMRLKGTDKIAGLSILFEGKADKNEQLLVVMQNGFGKRTPLKEFRIQGRGGSGVKAAKVTDKTGKIVSTFVVNAKRENEDVIIMSEKGQVIRLPLKAVSVIGRATQGVRLMRFKAPNDKVASVTFV